MKHCSGVFSPQSVRILAALQNTSWKSLYGDVQNNLYLCRHETLGILYSITARRHGMYYKGEVHDDAFRS